MSRNQRPEEELGEEMGTFLFFAAKNRNVPIFPV